MRKQKKYLPSDDGVGGDSKKAFIIYLIVLIVLIVIPLVLYFKNGNV